MFLPEEESERRCEKVVWYKKVFLIFILFYYFLTDTTPRETSVLAIKTPKCNISSLMNDWTFDLTIPASQQKHSAKIRYFLALGDPNLKDFAC